MSASAASVAALRVAQSPAGRGSLWLVIIALIVAGGVLLTPLALVVTAVTAGTPPPPAKQPPSDVPAAAGEWVVPLAGNFMKGRGFGQNPVIVCSYCSVDHQGYDMSQGCGSTIFASGPGTVITAERHQGYGNTVRIDHGDHLVTLYGHMEDGSLRVQVGDTVTGGTALGAEGNTGRSFGCHLHFEVTDHGTSIDPSPFLNALGLTLP